jgi:hypothetical protein
LIACKFSGALIRGRRLHLETFLRCGTSNMWNYHGRCRKREADPAHSFLAAAETAPERKLWDTGLERARSCATTKEFSPPALCFLKSTPKKCQSLVYDALLGSRKQQPWYLCVVSCGDAGWYSWKFGECSRDLG